MEATLRALFDAPVLDLSRLKEVAARGVPDHLRATTWKFLLGYIPLQRSKRADAVQASREQYRVFLDAVVTRPQHDDDAGATAQPPRSLSDPLGVTGGAASSSASPPSPPAGTCSGSAEGSPEFRPMHLPRLVVIDDPLAHAASQGGGEAASGGKWEQWHKDEELRVEIDKDIQVMQPQTPPH